MGFNGWLQPKEAMDGIVPKMQLMAYEDDLPPTPSLAIGWSLGGAVLMQAVLTGRTKPSKIVLIATPFCFLDDNIGMAAADFTQFRQHFRHSPAMAARRFSALIAIGDVGTRPSMPPLPFTAYWAGWLERLGRVNFRTSDLSTAPPVLIVQGKQDQIVQMAQGRLWQKQLPNSRLLELECGHAPQLACPAEIRAAIREFADA